MATQTVPVLKVDASYWDSSSAWVQCPYCENTHRHGLRPGYRVSHCFPGGSYEFRLPIDRESGHVGYEIDKRRARFVNCSWNEDEMGESNLLNSFSSMRISTKKTPHLEKDAHEMIRIPLPDGGSFELKRTENAISNCVEGRLGQVRRYLETSSEAHVFLQGKDDSGDTTLIMAAAEKSEEMVSLLLEHGADKDATNHDGRSALMQAALWGRVETVRLLLSSGADKSLKDYDGRNAVDLSREDRKNEKERRSKSRLASARDFSTGGADRRRHIIIALGAYEETRPKYTAPVSEAQLINYQFRKSEAESTITLLGPVDRHPLTYAKSWETVAFLHRGEQFAIIKGTSGWVQDALPRNEGPGRNWVDQVHIISNTVGHTLQPHSYDHGAEPGTYSACHAEKKLIAYFIDKHVFLPHERKPHQEHANEISMREGLDTRLVELSKHEPPISLRQATILISNVPCVDCEQFTTKVNDFFQLNILLSCRY